MYHRYNHACIQTSNFLSYPSALNLPWGLGEPIPTDFYNPQVNVCECCLNLGWRKFGERKQPGCPLIWFVRRSYEDSVWKAEWWGCTDCRYTYVFMPLFCHQVVCKIKKGFSVSGLKRRLTKCRIMHSWACTGALREGSMSVPGPQEGPCVNWNGAYCKKLKGLVQSNGH